MIVNDLPITPINSELREGTDHVDAFSGSRFLAYNMKEVDYVGGFQTGFLKASGFLRNIVGFLGVGECAWS